MLFPIFLILVILFSWIWPEENTYNGGNTLSKKINIVIPETMQWEKDFFQWDLFQNYNIEYLEYGREIGDKQNYAHQVLVVGQPIPNDLQQILEVRKPRIIVHISDEAGIKPDWMQWIPSGSLFLHNYNHQFYLYPQNSIQIPLGYIKGFLNGKSWQPQPSDISHRPKFASFVGVVKSDRRKMLNVFAKKNMIVEEVTNNWNVVQQVIKPRRCFEIYSQSVFVLCGRGFYSLDCFRIYEAIVAGAIPVIAGDPEEIRTTFKYDGDEPPFIHARTWEHALKTCESLFANTQKLIQKQKELQEWFGKKISLIRSRIAQSGIV